MLWIKRVPDQKKLLEFVHFVANMVCVSDDDWEDKFSGNSIVFPELACRKLYKLGVIDKDSDGNWVYNPKR